MFDYCVIGGGIAGLSAAAALAEHGTVCVLEREDSLGYHASGRAAGIFVADYGNAAVCALNRASFGALQAMEALSPRAMMMVAAQNEAEPFETEAASLGLREISLEDARARCDALGPSVARAALREDAFDLDTDRCLAHFRAQALANGAEIKLRAEVTSIARVSDAWRVTTAAGEVEARALVNAAGAWVDEIATLAKVRKINIQPKRRSMAIVPWPDGKMRKDWPFVDGVNESWYAKPDPAGLIVSPSDSDPVAPFDAWPEDMVIAEGLARFEALMDFPVERVTRTWAGLRSFVEDGALVIGPDPEVDGFFWCAAQGGYGFQVAPAAAAVLAHHVVGTPTPVDASATAALSPSRFRA